MTLFLFYCFLLNSSFNTGNQVLHQKTSENLSPSAFEISNVHSQVSAELSFQILAESVLTEPQVAHVASRSLTDEHALFIGNSMVVRDLDMFGHSWSKFTDKVDSLMFHSNMPSHLIRVGANRGASGIDGLVSTAVGFAMGANKRVSWFHLVSEISFIFVLPCLILLFSSI